MANPTDAELIAALAKGIESGQFVEVTDEYLANLKAETEED